MSERKEKRLREVGKKQQRKTLEKVQKEEEKFLYQMILKIKLQPFRYRFLVAFLILFGRANEETAKYIDKKVK